MVAIIWVIFWALPLRFGHFTNKLFFFFFQNKVFSHCLLYKIIDREVVCCFYLLSPSCDHGSNRGVHGRNWSGGQQHRSPSLWHHWKSCTCHLLAERRAASTCRLAAPHHRRRDSAPGQPLCFFYTDSSMKADQTVTMSSWKITLWSCFSSSGSRFQTWLDICV